MNASKSVLNCVSVSLIALSSAFVGGCGAGTTSSTSSSTPTPSPTPAPSPTPTPAPSSVTGWTWVGGSSSIASATGVYGTQGVAATSNVPDVTSSAASWTDKSGNFWLFSGGGENVLWELNPSTKQWTWVSGSHVPNATGVYGTRGVPAPENVPGGRYSPLTWTDTSGHLWLFGGGTPQSANSALNDLWMFDVSAKQWTWVSGSSIPGAPGAYGTQGLAAPSNVPGARYNSSAWTDKNGNLWLFGGTTYDAIGNMMIINDLWEFSPSSREWTWVNGSNQGNAPTVYGTKGSPAPTNMPGSRFGSMSWTDRSGNMWLFGGSSPSRLGLSDLNDLWKFDPSAKEWTWVAGSNTAGQVVAGVYGTQGVASANNMPGSRGWGTSWVDASGNLWLFGGQGFDSTGLSNDNLNDLWKFDPIINEWTWVTGSSTIPLSLYGQPGIYGTIGVTAASNTPGGKVSAVSWTDTSGNLWLFGGDTFDSAGRDDALNDLWQYQP